MGEKRMNRIAMSAAVIGACVTLALPVGQAFADETADLRAEIAAQRAQLEAQRLRLEALEKKLDATAAAQEAAASQQATSQQGGSVKEALSSFWASGAPQPAAERLVAAANDVGSGITFQVTPADSVTLYGLLDITLSNISNANANGDHKTDYQVAWFSGNRWGITGRDALAPTLPRSEEQSS